MKLTPLVLVALPMANGFSMLPTTGRQSTKLDAMVYYDSQTGNTEKCAEYIAEAAGIKFEFIGDVTDQSVKDQDAIIVGAPTWHTGEVRSIGYT
jgi:flavorubredoxin